MDEVQAISDNSIKHQLTTAVTNYIGATIKVYSSGLPDSRSEPFRCLAIDSATV